MLEHFGKGKSKSLNQNKLIMKNTTQLSFSISNEIKDILMEQVNALHTDVSTFLNKLIIENCHKNEITPELKAKIYRAELEHQEGKCVVCHTPEEITQHLNSLV